MTGMGTARNHYTIQAFKEPPKTLDNSAAAFLRKSRVACGYLTLLASCSARQGKSQQHSRDGEPERDEVGVIDALKEMRAKDQPVGIEDLAEDLSQSCL